MQSGKRCSTSYLVFGASLRSESLNKRLASLAASVVAEAGGTVIHASMSDFDCPSYNADVEIKEGIPAGADRFRSNLVSTDGFIIASPEYNASMPGVLKNLVDWVSRYKPQPAMTESFATPSCRNGSRERWIASSSLSKQRSTTRR